MGQFAELSIFPTRFWNEEKILKNICMLHEFNLFFHEEYEFHSGTTSKNFLNIAYETYGQWGDGVEKDGVETEWKSHFFPPENA